MARTSASTLMNRKELDWMPSALCDQFRQPHSSLPQAIGHLLVEHDHGSIEQEVLVNWLKLSNRAELTSCLWCEEPGPRNCVLVVLRAQGT